MDAQVLFQQLGGNMFFVMTGVKAEVKGEDYVQFKLPRNKTNASRLTIKLVGDLYTLHFSKLNKKTFELETKGLVECIGAENLREVFERCTGLYTRL